MTPVVTDRERWIALGLLLAVATGLGAMLLSYPFLTSHTAHLGLPVLGEVHVPSAMFFDLGVFAVVVGATMLIITALAHQSLRTRRPARAQPESSEPRSEDLGPRPMAGVEETVG